MPASRNHIPHRTKEFALGVIRLFSTLPKGFAAEVIGKQVLRSATSVGAHVREGKRARSVAEMISKTDVALQELEETIYWLELLADADIVQPEAVRTLLKEAGELVAMLSSASRTLKLKQPARPSRSTPWPRPLPFTYPRWLGDTPGGPFGGVPPTKA
jgi:four helix bundle protein